MTKAFGSQYARQYDLLYGDKDYDAEVDMIERVVARYREAARSFIDFGCGTGQHSMRLAQRGYSVTGVDRSADMLSVAREKASVLAHGVARLEFIEGDVRTSRLGRTVDVVLMMFAVLGYQLTNTDVRAALATARAHLEPGGLFIADVWYGPAVLTTRPSDRTKTVETEHGRVVRSAHAELDTFAHRADVTYHIQHLERGHVIAEFSETHQMRYFFPQELALLLEAAGFTMLALHAFDDDDAPVSDDTWNALMIARAT
jgi:SAM-dependent methyltransferase